MTGSEPATSQKPRDDELDVFGLTNTGRVRRDNQDHFLFCTLHKTLRVRVTSLATPELLEMPSERLASLFERGHLTSNEFVAAKSLVLTPRS